MPYSISTADFKPSEATTSSTCDWRAWWQHQSAIDGTDWRTLLDAAEQVLSKLRALHVGASS